MTEESVQKGVPHSPSGSTASVEQDGSGELSLEAAQQLCENYYAKVMANLEDTLSDEETEDLQSALRRIALAAVSEGLNREPMHWDNPQELYAAYEKLSFFGVENDITLSSLYVAVCFALELYPDAEAVALDSGCAATPDFQRIQEQITRQLAFPLFRNDFAARCRRAWTDFFNGLSVKLKLFQEDLDLESLTNSIDTLCSTFRPCMGFHVAPYPQTPQMARDPQEPPISLCILPEELALDIFPVEFAVSQMPDSLQGLCSISVGPPAGMREPSDLFFEEFKLYSIRISVSDTPEHIGADILYDDSAVLSDLPVIDADVVVRESLARGMIRFLLGDYLTDMQIHSVSISNSQLSPDSSCSLPELPQRLQELGYPEAVPPADYFQHLHRTYTRKDAVSGKLLRDDITSGWTDCMQLQEEYEQDDFDAFYRYMDLGVSAVFVAWPKSLDGGSNPDLLSQLKEHLAGISSPPSCRIIGEASGTQSCYLDLLIWNQKPILQALEDCFQRVPNGELAQIQSFKRGAPAFSILLNKLSQAAPQP